MQMSPHGVATIGTNQLVNVKTAACLVTDFTTHEHQTKHVGGLKEAITMPHWFCHQLPGSP